MRESVERTLARAFDTSDIARLRDRAKLHIIVDDTLASAIRYPGTAQKPDHGSQGCERCRMVRVRRQDDVPPDVRLSRSDQPAGAAPVDLKAPRINAARRLSLRHIHEVAQA